MFTHVCLGADDLAQARAFYVPVMEALGIPLVKETDSRLIFFKDGQTLLVGHPIDGRAATPANGGTISLAADSAEMVDAFHAAGLANGGSEEGAPGARPQADNRYGAYLRDPTGNKICAFTPKAL